MANNSNVLTPVALVVVVVVLQLVIVVVVLQVAIACEINKIVLQVI